MLRTTSVVLTLVLSGCAAQAPGPSPVQIPDQAPSPAQLLSAGERTIVIQSENEDSATALAEKECIKRGRHARLAIKASPVKYVFDCIE